jgi:heptaprenyl diphosphate synthase
MLRIFVGNLLMGSLFAPGFLLSLGGGLIATALMSVSYELWKGKIGPVGVSVIGGLGHVGGQLVIAWLIVVRHPSVWILSPFFLIFALISGIVNGLVADYLVELLNKRNDLAALRDGEREAACGAAASQGT